MPKTRLRPQVALLLVLVGALLPTVGARAEDHHEQARLDAAVADFYGRHHDAPAWTDPGRRRALLQALKGVAEDGLDPEDYALSTLRRHWSNPHHATDDDSERLATRAAIRALSHLLGGKLDPRELNPDWNFQARRIDDEAELRGLSDAIDQGRLAELFAHAHPPHPFYDRLKAGLRWLRRIEADGGWPALGPGPTLRLGLSDPRVAPLRQRLRIGGYRIDADAATPELFDLELQHAVERFQREHRLNADGAVGKITQAELDLPVSARIDQMRVNLERARWLLHETSREFLLIDIAGFRAIHFEDGVQTWRTRIQVGQAFRQTPEYRSRITHVDFNPSWTIPPTIFRKDMLPRIRRDPDYLTRQKLRVLDADSGEQLDPAGVDWNDPRGILLRQDPGPGNALGRIAIRFPNPYAIYLHDTPHCALFSRDERALSSGCIRVENPIDLVERLLADPERWSRQRIETIIADGRGIRAQLPRTVTILLTYWTVEVHDDDRVSFRRDVYGRDAAVLAALNRRCSAGFGDADLSHVEHGESGTKLEPGAVLECETTSRHRSRQRPLNEPAEHPDPTGRLPTLRPPIPPSRATTTNRPQPPRTTCATSTKTPSPSCAPWPRTTPAPGFRPTRPTTNTPCDSPSFA